jgi:hypothetical protein
MKWESYQLSSIFYFKERRANKKMPLGNAVCVGSTSSHVTTKLQRAGYTNVYLYGDFNTATQSVVESLNPVLIVIARNANFTLPQWVKDGVTSGKWGLVSEWEGSRSILNSYGISYTNYVADSTQSSATKTNIAPVGHGLANTPFNITSSLGDYEFFARFDTSDPRVTKIAKTDGDGRIFCAEIDINSPGRRIILFGSDWQDSVSSTSTQQTMENQILAYASTLRNKAPNAPIDLSPAGTITNPGVVNTLTPILKWSFSDPDTWDKQSAFQVQVKSKNMLTMNQANIETDLSGIDLWTQNVSTGSLVRDTTKTISGGGSAKATSTYAGTQALAIRTFPIKTPITAGKTYTGSVYMLGSAVRTARCNIFFTDNNGNIVGSAPGSDIVLSTTNWTRAVVTGTAPAGATQCWIEAFVNNASQNESFYADAFQLEEGSTARMFENPLKIDTGKVMCSSPSYAIPPFDVDTLNWDETYSFQVKIWDSGDTASPWSSPQYFKVKRAPNLSGSFNLPVNGFITDSLSRINVSFNDGSDPDGDVLTYDVEFTSNYKTLNFADVTISPNPYTTAGSGGSRKVLRFGNRLIVAAMDKNAKKWYVFYSDNGSPWNILTNGTNAQSIQDVCIEKISDDKFVLFHGWDNAGIAYIVIDAFTGTWLFNGNVDSGQTAIGTISAIRNLMGAEIHLFWSSKNSTYSNSFNIRYSKGTINANGSITWSSPQQWTVNNTANVDAQNPCALVTPTRVLCFYDFHNGSSLYQIRILICNSGLIPQADNIVYSGAGYFQAYVTACRAPSGRLWIAWHGTDPIDSSYVNIRVSFSDDDASSWSAPIKVTKGSGFECARPSITATRYDDVFIVFDAGWNSSGGISDIMYVYYKNGSWSNPIKLKDNTTASAAHATTLIDNDIDFTVPLFAYLDTQGGRLGFFGTCDLSNWIKVGKNLPTPNLNNFLIPPVGTTTAKFKARAYDGASYSQFIYSDNFTINPPSDNSQAPNALEMNGIDTYAVIPNRVIPASGDFTYELFIKTSYNSYHEILDFVDTNAGTPNGLNTILSLHMLAGGFLRLWFTGGSSVQSVTSFNDGKLHHVAVRRSGNVFDVIVDGNTVITATNALDLAAADTIVIGKNGAFQADYYNGIISLPRFWNTARTNQQLFDNKNTIVPDNEPGLIDYFILDTTTGKLKGKKNPNWIGTIYGVVKWGYTLSPLADVTLPSLNIRSKDNIDYIRQKVNEFRQANGFPAYSWTDPIIIRGITPVKAIHWNEIQIAINEVYSQTGSQLASQTVQNTISEQIIPKDKKFDIRRDLKNRVTNLIKALKNES